MRDWRNRTAYAALYVLAGVPVVGLSVAVMCVAMPGVCVAVQYLGMTQDLLWRAGPSAFSILFWICLAGALGVSCWLLARLKGVLDAGRPFRLWQVTAPVVGTACFWWLVWTLWNEPAFNPLAPPMWLAD